MTPTFALVGPTASGKTRIALEIAPSLGAEILAVDSMTIYKGMDIGTAKPTAADRGAVPHHLLDIADPGERFSVAAFQRFAGEAIAGIRARGRTPLVVGGSGLYFRAVVDQLAFPPADPAVRARLQREDLATLAVRLKGLDPNAAEFIDPANRRRVVRALEVIEITGRPFSSFRADWGRRNPVVAAGLDIPAEALDARIRARFLAMLDGGFLDEVRALADAGYRDALTAGQAVGYREAVRYLDGELTDAGLVEEAVRATRRLARRQLSWFRRDPRVRWFEATVIERAASEVAAYYSERQRESRCGS